MDESEAKQSWSSFVSLYFNQFHHRHHHHSDSSSLPSFSSSLHLIMKIVRRMRKQESNIYKKPHHSRLKTEEEATIKADGEKQKLKLQKKLESRLRKRPAWGKGPSEGDGNTSPNNHHNIFVNPKRRSDSHERLKEIDVQIQQEQKKLQLSDDTKKSIQKLWMKGN